MLRTVLDAVWLLQRIVVLAFVIGIKIGTIIYYEVTKSRGYVGCFVYTVIVRVS